MSLLLFWTGSPVTDFKVQSTGIRTARAAPPPPAPRTRAFRTPLPGFVAPTEPKLEVCRIRIVRPPVAPPERTRVVRTPLAGLGYSEFQLIPRIRVAKPRSLVVPHRTVVHRSAVPFRGETGFVWYVLAADILQAEADESQVVEVGVQDSIVVGDQRIVST